MIVLPVVIVYSVMIAATMGGILIAKYLLNEEHDVFKDDLWCLCMTAFIWPITMIPAAVYYLIRLYFYRKDM